MKKLNDPVFVSCISAGLGVLCLLSRLWMMKTGIDSRDLLVPGHPGGILSWILTGIFVLFLAASAILRPEKYSFQSNLPSSFGAVLYALALLGTVFFVLTDTTVALPFVLAVLAGIGALSSGFLAFFRFRGQRAWLPLYLPALLTLMLQFLYCFRHWGAESELQRYVFSLSAQVFLLLCLFYRAAAECKMRAPLLYHLFSSAAIFFGLSAAADSGVGWLYSLWALAVLLENLGLRTFGSKQHAAS